MGVDLGGFHGGSGVKNLPANAGDAGSIPGFGRSPREGNGYSLQYSCLGNPMDREPGQLQSMGLQSRTQLKWLSMHAQLIYNVLLTSIGQQSDSVIHMCVYADLFSCIQLFVTLWNVACQAPLSMGFSRQEYWSGLPWPPPGDLPHPGIEPESLTSRALAGRFFITSAIREALSQTYIYSFSYSFPLWFITGYRIQFPVLYSRTLFFILLIYNSVHNLSLFEIQPTLYQMN